MLTVTLNLPVVAESLVHLNATIVYAKYNCKLDEINEISPKGWTDKSTSSVALKKIIDVFCMI